MCPLPSRKPTCSAQKRGYSLVEVMAAVAILSVALVVMLAVRNRAVAQAVDARNLSLAARLGLQLLHRIEAGRIPDIVDGYQGDFSDAGFAAFHYVIGLGDGSNFAASGLSAEELAWRGYLETRAEEAKDEEAERPEFTRVFVTVRYPGGGGEEAEYRIETLLPTWAVYQDFEAYEERWAQNRPAKVE